MKLIDPSFEIWEQEPTLNEAFKQIEFAARTCYKSENNIKGDSKLGFIHKLVQSKHYAMLEHGTIYLKIPWNKSEKYPFAWVLNSPYSLYVENGKDHTSNVTTNYRVIVENNADDLLNYIAIPNDQFFKRVTVRFVCSRAVAQEFTRHRAFSFAMESQRYCNYSKDKFDNEITFITPNWVNTHCPNKHQKGPSAADLEWSTAMQNAEASYFLLLKEGWKPEEAREVLPNSTKTELIMTGFTEDWEHFFDLRALGTTGKPHPEAKRLVEPLMQEFINRKLITDS